jgi:hypothetical protein
MNDALARLRAELEAAAAKDKADALAAQEMKLTVRRACCCTHRARSCVRSGKERSVLT